MATARRLTLLALLLPIAGWTSCGSGANPDLNPQPQPPEPPTRPTTPEFDAQRAFSVLEAQVGFGPRAPGTPGHDQCEEYIVGELGKYATGTIKQEFRASTRFGGPYDFANLVGFFGPDEGTAPLMDAVALRARERGYKYWRTITTGKSFGIPHDTYGLLSSGEVFGLYSRGGNGTDLQVAGKSKCVTLNMDEIYDHIGDDIELSGMTTTSIMSAFRTLIEHYGEDEQDQMDDQAQDGGKL